LKGQAGGLCAGGHRWPSAASQALSGGLCFVKALRANSRVQVLSPGVGLWHFGSRCSVLIAAVFSSAQAGRTSGQARLSLQGQRQGQGNFASTVSGSSSRAPARRGLTPPSSRAPTAKHLGRATVQAYFYCSAAQALRRWCRLMSNVRPRGKHRLMHLPASSPVFMKPALCSPCRLPAVKGLVRRRSSLKVQVAFCRFANFDWHSLPCEGASRQQPGSGSVGRRRVSACGFKVLSAHRSRRFIAAHRPHSPAGTTQSAGSAQGARPLPAHGQRLKQSRSGAAWPNPSIKPSPNSKAPGPRYSALSLVLQRGPGTLPLVPAYVER